MADVFAGLPVRDVDIANYAKSDFPTLAEGAEYVAYGEDGVIAPGSFTLTSAFPFATQGAQFGHVVVLKRHGTNSATNGPAVDNDVLPVASAADGALGLARFGYGAGQGAFPGKPAGSTAVLFSVPSLLSLITAETAEVYRMLGVVTSVDLVNAADLKKLVTLKVLRDLYFDAAKQAQNDAYLAKTKDLDAQIVIEIASLKTVYGQDTSLSHRPQSMPLVDDPRWARRVPSAGLWPGGVYGFDGREW